MKIILIAFFPKAKKKQKTPKTFIPANFPAANRKGGYEGLDQLIYHRGRTAQLTVLLSSELMATF